VTLAGDPFAVLGLTPRFGLSSTELERRQRELFAERRGEGTRALEAVNHAVLLLKDPAQRAELLLRLRGWPLKGADDPALLVRIFAEREGIERARLSRDLAALRAYVEAARPRLMAIQSELTSLLDASEAPSAGEHAVAEPCSPERASATTPLVAGCGGAPARALLLVEELRYLSRAVTVAESAISVLSDEA
jgi:hypothetical protein